MRMVEDVVGGAAAAATAAAALKGFPAAWRVAAKPCDYCKSSAALLFCRVDSAFMCMPCDTRVHSVSTNKHERVWICEVCEHAPASVTCKADAAALCVTCDRDIHSANPLAQRHERTPVIPFYDTAESVVKSINQSNNNNNNNKNNNNNTSYHLEGMGVHALQVTQDTNQTKLSSCPGHTSYGSWVSQNNLNTKYAVEAPDLKSMEYLLSGSDPFLDFDYPVSLDSVVPVQTMKPPPPFPTETRFEIDFTRSSINSYSNTYSTHQQSRSLTHSVSSSSLDVGVVPDESSISDTSYTLSGTPNGHQASAASQLVGKDREARVLRYREKRKNRKFKKTIRYASRKAYAETRPRVKGRFAKRTSSADVECDQIDQIFSCDSGGFSFSGARYGVVPSF